MKLFFASLVSSVAGTSLTEDNWDKMTAGKQVFIKFQAPWWGHCKRMKPDWDKLMEEYKGNPTSLVADVDCTADGKSLCEKHQVRGYPTVKHGDPKDLKDYEGGRSFEELKKFADGNLGPRCGAASLEHCNDEMKKAYEPLLKMKGKKLKSEIDHMKEDLKTLEDRIKLHEDAYSVVWAGEAGEREAQELDDMDSDL